MNKQLLAALLAIPAVLSAGHASANPWLNGTQINGLSAPAPDFRLNDTQINGLPVPAAADICCLNGTQINGLVAPGPIVQLIQSQSSAAAPNWSALQVSGMTVRLASGI
ncbi:hypothetical protein M2650_01620 [Luteimonas sp. SX5]|uniref:Uncharacterized protein n=1 Tax=Luteimonas galliterrae TaxID=2940486 RepID=A0ABT0MEQ5_9GAMM|nr:hypothetical protein [Luteimonas galliterrae]MCL1633345.1 hypothetical protein [Luteimonas galliterrae]